MTTRLLISTCLLSAFALSSACLPSAEVGTQPDMALPVDETGHVETPPEGPPSEPPSPADLAGSVQIDAFVSSGTATMSLSATTATMRLNDKKDITVTITGNGAMGTATLALVGAPTGLTATFNPPTVTLAGSPVPVTMTVSSASNMDPATSVASNVQLTVGAATSKTTFGVTVMPELLVNIATGVNIAASNPTAFGAATIPVKLIGTGTKLTFVNNDGIVHRIHADGTGGLAHEANNMAANGGTYTATLTAKGPISFRCHIHGNMKGVINVQ